MVWVKFCVSGMLSLTFPSRRTNSVEYITILESKLLSLLEEYNLVQWTHFYYIQ